MPKIDGTKAKDSRENIYPRNNAYHQYTLCSFEGITFNISNFETSMTILKYLDTSHISKLGRDIAVLQDH
jgi:hypothetical protein